MLGAPNVVVVVCRTLKSTCASRSLSSAHGTCGRDACLPLRHSLPPDRGPGPNCVSAPSEARSRCRFRRCSLFLCALSCLMSAPGAWVRLRLRVAARGAVARVSDAPAHERRTARSGGRAVRPWEASRAPRSASTRLPRAGPVAPHHQTVAGTLPAPSRAQAPPLSRRYAIRNIWRRWRASKRDGL